jgi:hypothetical protein
MHNNIFFKRKKSLPYQKVGDLIDVHCIIFSIFFCLVMFHEPQTWGLMAIENYKLYTICTIILSNPLHLIVGSKLIFTQSEP